MISAGKVSATTTDRSRTTNGVPRQRTRCVGSCDARARQRVEIQFGRKHPILTRKSAGFGDRRRDLTDDAHPRRISRFAGDEDRRRLAGDEERIIAGANVTGTPSASHNSCTRPFASKKSTSRWPPDQCSKAPLPVHARPTPAFHRRRRTARPISNNPTSRRPWRRLWRTASTRPGKSAGRSVSNFADSGFATATAADENASTAFASMNPNVTASDSPAAARIRRTNWSRPMRGSGGGAAVGDDRERRLELVEADMPADFLDEVCLAQQIHAEGRRDDVPAVGGAGDLESQVRENPLHIRVRH
jgi:hypothetical protein